MTSEVTEHRLDAICLLVVDCPHATPKWTNSGVVVLRNTNIKGGRLGLSSPSYTDEEHYLGRVKRAVPQADDIVITREAPMGDVCQIPKGLKCCLGQRQVSLRPDPKKVDGRFDRNTHEAHEAKTLATLRDTLLPRLISGRLKLRTESSIKPRKF